MKNEAYRYAEMKPEQVEKLRQVERDLGRLTEREIVLVAYERDQASR